MAAVAWKSARRLITYLREGAQGGLIWDAFDNYHDHDKAWSLYGLVRRSRHEYTPKRDIMLRSTKQVYKFVRPESVRVASFAEDPSIHAEAFLHPQEGLTVTGLNMKHDPVLLHISGEDCQMAL